MTSIDWHALATVGLRHLGLRPAEFWALTPAELRIMLGPVEAQAPMARAAMERLMARFPDHPGKDGEPLS